MNIITVLHVIAEVAIVFYTGDALRRIVGHHHLLTVLACAAVCVGAFGGICAAARNGASIYDLALSAGVAIYCAQRHRAGLVWMTKPQPGNTHKAGA